MTPSSAISTRGNKWGGHDAMNCTNNWWPGPDRTGDLRFSGGGAADTNVFQLFRSGQIAPIGRSGPPSPPVWPHFRPINRPTTCPDVAAPRHRAQRSRRAVGAASSTRPHGAVTLVSGSGDGSVSAMGSPAGLAVPRRSAEWRTSTRDQWIPKPCDVTTPGVAHFHCATIRLAVSTLRRQLGNSDRCPVIRGEEAVTETRALAHSLDRRYSHLCGVKVGDARRKIRATAAAAWARPARVASE